MPFLKRRHVAILWPLTHAANPRVAELPEMPDRAMWRRPSVEAVELALTAAENALLNDSGCEAPIMDESDKAVIGLVLKWVHHRHHAVTEAQLLHQEVHLHAARITHQSPYTLFSLLYPLQLALYLSPLSLTHSHLCLPFYRTRCLALTRRLSVCASGRSRARRWS